MGIARQGRETSFRTIENLAHKEMAFKPRPGELLHLGMLRQKKRKKHLQTGTAAGTIAT
jgi:hypothetical protein